MKRTDQKRQQSAACITSFFAKPKKDTASPDQKEIVNLSSTKSFNQIHQSTSSTDNDKVTDLEENEPLTTQKVHPFFAGKAVQIKEPDIEHFEISIAGGNPVSSEDDDKAYKSIANIHPLFLKTLSKRSESEELIEDVIHEPHPTAKKRGRKKKLPLDRDERHDGIEDDVQKASMSALQSLDDFDTEKSPVGDVSSPAADTTEQVTNGRPRRQAVLKAIARQEQIKMGTYLNENEIDYSTKLKSSKASQKLSNRKQKYRHGCESDGGECNSDEDDQNSEDEDGDVWQTKKSLKKSSVSQLFFLNKEEKARKKAQQEEERRLLKEAEDARRAEEELQRKIQREQEQERRIREQFLEQNSRKQKEVHGSFGRGLNPFFKQQFVRDSSQIFSQTGDQSCDGSFEREFDGTDPIGQGIEECSRFPQWQHVGLPPAPATQSSQVCVGPTVRVGKHLLPLNVHRSLTLSIDGKEAGGAETCSTGSQVATSTNTYYGQPNRPFSSLREAWVAYFAQQILFISASSTTCTHTTLSSSSVISTVMHGSAVATMQALGGDARLLGAPRECMDLTKDAESADNSVREVSKTSVADLGVKDVWGMLSKKHMSVQQGQESFSVAAPVAGVGLCELLQPTASAQVCGNKIAVRSLRHWLQVWAGKRRAHKSKKAARGKPKRRRACRSRWGDDVDDEADDDQYGGSEELWDGEGGDGQSGCFSNLLVLQGPSGCGKTAAVYACARELGFNVIELSASQERKGAEVRKLVAEASQSHGLGAAAALSRGGGGEGTELGGSHANGSTSSRTRDNKNMASQTTGSVNGSRGRVGGGTQSEKAGCTSDLNLILFDEADIVFDDEASLYSAIQQMAKVAKCPLVLTSEVPLNFLRTCSPRIIHMRRPSPNEACEVLHRAATLSGITSTIPELVLRSSLELLAMICDGDLRASLNILQLFGGSCRTIHSCDKQQHFQPFCRWLADQDVTSVAYDFAFSAENSLDAQSAALRGPVPSPLHVEPRLGIDQQRLVVGTVEQLRERRVRALDQAKIGAIVSPVIYSLEPRRGLCAGGYVVTLHGRNFLQYQCRQRHCYNDTAAAEQEQTEHEEETHRRALPWAKLMPVEVSIGGIVCAPSDVVVLSDRRLAFVMPSIPMPGVHIVNVRLTGVDGSISASSELSGSGHAWVLLSDRKFTDIRLHFLAGGANSKSQKRKEALQSERRRGHKGESGSKLKINNSKGLDGFDLSDDEEQLLNSEELVGENGRAVVDHQRSARSSLKFISLDSADVSEPASTNECVDDADEDDDDDFVVGSFRTKKRKVPLSKQSRKSSQVRRRAMVVDESDDEVELDGSEPRDNLPVARHPSDEMTVDGAACVGVGEIAGPCRDKTAAGVPLQPATSEVAAALNDCLLAAMLDSLLHLQATAARAVLPFSAPVLPEVAPDYLEVISHPMDLGTVQSSVRENLYVRTVTNVVKNEPALQDASEEGPVGRWLHDEVDVSAFVADVRLVWSNCRDYNEPHSMLVRASAQLEQVFEMRLLESLETIAVSPLGKQCGMSSSSNSIRWKGETIFEASTAVASPRLMGELPGVDVDFFLQSLADAENSRQQLQAVSSVDNIDGVVEVSPVSLSRPVAVLEAQFSLGLEYTDESQPCPLIGVVTATALPTIGSCVGCILALEDLWGVADACAAADLMSTASMKSDQTQAEVDAAAAASGRCSGGIAWIWRAGPASLADLSDGLATRSLATLKDRIATVGEDIQTRESHDEMYEVHSDELLQKSALEHFRSQDWAAEALRGYGRNIRAASALNWQHIKTTKGSLISAAVQDRVQQSHGNAISTGHTDANESKELKHGPADAIEGMRAAMSGVLGKSLESLNVDKSLSARRKAQPDSDSDEWNEDDDDEDKMSTHRSRALHTRSSGRRSAISSRQRNKRRLESSSESEESNSVDSLVSASSDSESVSDADCDEERCTSIEEAKQCDNTAGVCVASSSAGGSVPLDHSLQVHLGRGILRVWNKRRLFCEHVNATLCGDGDLSTWSPFALLGISRRAESAGIPAAHNVDECIRHMSVSLRRILILDYLPMLAKMVQSECLIDCGGTYAGNASGARRSGRKQGRSHLLALRHHHTSASTHLSESQLDKLMLFGFVAAHNRILDPVPCWI